MHSLKSQFFCKTISIPQDKKILDIVSEMKSEINSLRDTINNHPKERSSVIGEIRKLSSEVTASVGSLPQKVDHPKLSFAKVASIKSKNMS